MNIHVNMHSISDLWNFHFFFTYIVPVIFSTCLRKLRFPTKRVNRFAKISHFLCSRKIRKFSLFREQRNAKSWLKNLWKSFKEKMRKFCEKRIRRRNYQLWCNKTSNAELRGQRISKAFLRNNYSFRRISRKFAFFRLIHFRKKEKFRENFCENFLFAGNPNLSAPYII